MQIFISMHVNWLQNEVHEKCTLQFDSTSHEFSEAPLYMCLCEFADKKLYFFSLLFHYFS